MDQPWLNVGAALDILTQHWATNFEIKTDYCHALSDQYSFLFNEISNENTVFRFWITILVMLIIML